MTLCILRLCFTQDLPHSERLINGLVIVVMRVAIITVCLGRYSDFFLKERSKQYCSSAITNTDPLAHSLKYLPTDNTVGFTELRISTDTKQNEKPGRFLPFFLNISPHSKGDMNPAY